MHATILPIRRRAHLLAAATLGLILVVSALGSPASDAAEPQPQAQSCSPAQEGAAATQVHAIDSNLRDVEGFTGVALESCSLITVYGKSGTAVEQAFAQTDSSPVPVTFAPVANSLKELNTSHEKVLALNMELLQRGVDVVGFWPDIRTGRETLAVRNLTPEDQDIIGEVAGDDIAVLAAENAPIELTATRANDAIPFTAGNFIATTNAMCTSGAGIHFEGQGPTRSSGFLTAGHCSTTGSAEDTRPSTGNAWNNSYYDRGVVPTGSQLPIGYTSVNFFSQELDAAVIRTPTPSDTSNYVFSGSTTSSARVYQSGVQRALVGDRVCTLGAFEGRRCAGTVQSDFFRGCINIRLHPDAPKSAICSIVWATSNGLLNGSGDSGGPVYLRDLAGTGFTLTGLISAGSKPWGCADYTWRFNGAGGGCYSDVYFTDLKPALNRAGAVLNTPGNP